jgi:hypothetical protein
MRSTLGFEGVEIDAEQFWSNGCVIERLGLSAKSQTRENAAALIGCAEELVSSDELWSPPMQHGQS